MNVKFMGILNLNSDSFYAPSRVDMSEFEARVEEFARSGASIIDLGAVSTRPGAQIVGVEEEWRRLEPALRRLLRRGTPCNDGMCPCNDGGKLRISIDTTSSIIVRRSYEFIGSFIVNDISAGEDDPEMLTTVGELGLEYVAMHKRGNPRTMDSLCLYPNGVISELLEYFRGFELRAEACGVKSWILDPGLGFAKTADQNWEILHRLDELALFGRTILVGAADKRFTGGDTQKAHRIAIQSLSRLTNPPELILRVHSMA